MSAQSLAPYDGIAPGLSQARPGNVFEVFTPEALAQSVPARFEQQVRRYPERIALKTPRHALTYAALNQIGLTQNDF